MTDAIDETLTPAATVLLVRPSADDSLEVAMVERHANVGFAGGALVFPGGKVDAADSDPSWRGLTVGLSEDQTLAAAQIAALRETFEEVGLLLASRDGERLGAHEVLAFSEWRKKSDNDASVFLDLIQQENLCLHADELTLFAHWSPPPGVGHRRFDTRFFIAKAPAGQEIEQDGVETTEAIWIAPDRALDDGKVGRRKVIFPTARNLELLNVSESVSAAISFAKSRKIVRVQPGVEDIDGVKCLTIPDGLGYPVLSEPIESALRA
ncbi:MAG: NUDIX domain-containing protein [Pseudomonadota bacterium]